jgi:hypothetical protein
VAVGEPKVKVLAVGGPGFPGYAPEGTTLQRFALVWGLELPDTWGGLIEESFSPSFDGEMMAAPLGFVEGATQEDFESQIAGNSIPNANAPNAHVGASEVRRLLIHEGWNAPV